MRTGCIVRNWRSSSEAILVCILEYFLTLVSPTFPASHKYRAMRSVDKTNVHRCTTLATGEQIAFTLLFRPGSVDAHFIGTVLDAWRKLRPSLNEGTSPVLSDL